MTATKRADLPLEDYDHLNVGTLAGRIRSLDADQLAKVLAFEESHGRRMPVLQVLRRRLAEVKGGAPLSKGSGAPTTAATDASEQGDDADADTQG
ncbi:MAG: hypothetical protein U0Q15_02725 [Kineosporiaceae bacterium]